LGHRKRRFFSGQQEFWLKSSFEIRRNTLCISRISKRRVGAKGLLFQSKSEFAVTRIIEKWSQESFPQPSQGRTPPFRASANEARGFTHFPAIGHSKHKRQILPFFHLQLPKNQQEAVRILSTPI
jgi:hypothetical protein